MKKKKIIVLVTGLIIIAALLVGIFLIPAKENGESINGTMRDEVLHETNKINLFGLEVNPGLISAFTVTGVIFVFSLIVRIFVIPKFTYVPKKFQLVLETAVGTFDDMAKSSSPGRNKFLGAYIFTAAAYIFIGTLFELLGLQAVTTLNRSVSLPAPLADINGAITMGCVSYLVILGGGIVSNGIKGVGKTLKDFSLPISMSFRLFGALLSGALVTALVYYFSALSFVLPVVVGVMFTLLHALIQAYVLTMITSLFYGEVSEKNSEKKMINIKNKKEVIKNA